MNFLPGGLEWVFLLLIILVVFGGGRLPEAGRAIGKSIREFREASKRDDKKEDQPEGDKTEKSE